MAKNIINSVRTGERCCKHIEFWVVDPFGSVLTKLELNTSHVVKSPIIQTWWQEKLQIKLQFTKQGSNCFSHKTEILNLDPENGKLAGSYNYRIYVFINEVGKILHDSSEMTSSASCLSSFGSFEVLKSQIEIEYFLSDGCCRWIPALSNLKKLDAIGKMDQLLDFSIIVGKEELKVSKAILALASPVFLAMFDHDFKEKETQTLHFDDVDIDTVRRFIDYVCTYQPEPPTFTNLKSVTELLHMAEKYEVSSLKKLCLEHIYETFTNL